MGNNLKIKMKFALALVAAVEAKHHHMLVSDMKLFQPPERTSTTPKVSGRETGLPTRKVTHTIKTAPLPNLTTGRVPNNALNHGNAEVPDSAKEEDGAPDMTVAKELHFQTKLQVSPLTIEY